MFVNDKTLPQHFVNNKTLPHHFVNHKTLPHHFVKTVMIIYIYRYQPGYGVACSSTDTVHSGSELSPFLNLMKLKTFCNLHYVYECMVS